MDGGYYIFGDGCARVLLCRPTAEGLLQCYIFFFTNKKSTAGRPFRGLDTATDHYEKYTENLRVHR